MKNIFKAVLAAFCILVSFASAQAQLTTITASKIQMGGVPIASGLVTFTPVNSMGIPIAFSQGGGGLNSPTAFSCSITSGAITGTCQIPDAQLTDPANLLYTISIRNTATSAAFTLQSVQNITGASWSLDDYGPPASLTNVQTVQAIIGATVPASCTMPSIFTKTSTPTGLYYCVGGVFVLSSGAGGSSAPATDSAPGTVQLASGQTSTTLAKVATTGNYDDLTEVPSLGTAASQPSSAFDPAGAAAAAQAAAIAASTVATGAATPQGIPCTTPGEIYNQQVAGAIQQWIGSANCYVFTNTVTQQVVYAGTAAMVGVTNCYEINDGPGSSVIADSCGTSPLTTNGGGSGGAPTLHTHGMSFSGANSQYALGPASLIAQNSTYLLCAAIPTAVQPAGAQPADFYGSIGGSGFWALFESDYGNMFLATTPSTTHEESLQVIPSNSGGTLPTCMTMVYGGANNDQFWIGPVKLAYKNITPTLVSTTGEGFGLGASLFPMPMEALNISFTLRLAPYFRPMRFSIMLWSQARR